MINFFRNQCNIALVSLIATIGVTFLLLFVLGFSGVNSKIISKIGNITISISLPFLILNPIFGFIYSFFIKSKIKLLYMILHLACICMISTMAFIAFMFRYFVPFAP